MTKFNGFHFDSFRKNASKTMDVVGHKGDLLLSIRVGTSTERFTIKKGDLIVDPITDEEVKILYCSSNWFYVEGTKKYLIDLKDTLFYNF